MVSVMNLLNGNRISQGSASCDGTIQTQRSPFAIQELLGLGSTPVDPKSNSNRQSTGGCSSLCLPMTPYLPATSQSYQGRSTADGHCYADSGRVYFSPPTTFVSGLTALTPSVFGFDQSSPAIHQTDARTDYDWAAERLQDDYSYSQDLHYSGLLSDFNNKSYSGEEQNVTKKKKKRRHRLKPSLLPKL
ncbi:uncharacterized protein [Centruroides vittatus]|uniref:uncharacterized protein isoform X1 n=1 Tax=Centruroides vittatus TaxID=120091 RepID=UPI00350ED1A1